MLILFFYSCNESVSIYRSNEIKLLLYPKKQKYEFKSLVRYGHISNYGYWEQQDSLTIRFKPYLSIPIVTNVSTQSNKDTNNNAFTTVLVFDSMGKQLNINSLGVEIEQPDTTFFYYQQSIHNIWDGKIIIPNKSVNNGRVNLMDSIYKVNYGEINIEQGVTNVVTLSTSVAYYNESILFQFYPETLYGVKKDNTIIIDSILNAYNIYVKDTLKYERKYRLTRSKQKDLEFKFGGSVPKKLIDEKKVN